jgi:FMN phosphatase YigB (HAD superfamily)
MLDTILFDLDGTLLPFSEEEFVHNYFRRLCRKLAPHGYAPDDVVKTLWAGVKAMEKNDGTKLNRDVFWQLFEARFGPGSREVEALTDEFYGGEFDLTREVLHEQRDLGPLIRGLWDKGYTVALATNPIFPTVAVRTRLNWIGLTMEDFALVTTYDNFTTAKPNPDYFTAVLKALGKTGEQCVMVGNNTVEDVSSGAVGIPTILVEDFPEGDAPVSEYVQTMSFPALIAWLEALPKLN